MRYIIKALLLINFIHKRTTPSSFSIPSFIDVLMHMMHERIQDMHNMHVCHLAFMYVVHNIHVTMYENFTTKSIVIEIQIQLNMMS